MQILTTIVLSLLISFSYTLKQTCQDYINFFEGCKCDLTAIDTELYGSKSFNVTCGGLKDVLTINKIDHDSEQELYLNDDKKLKNFIQEAKNHLHKDNEFIQIKARCPFGSIQTQVETGTFTLSKSEITHVISKLIFIARTFYEKEYILTNLDPAQVCLDEENNPKLYDFRGIKIKGIPEIVNSVPKFMPPEYFNSYIEKTDYYFDQGYCSYQIGYMFYYMMKRKHPYILRDSPTENIWKKELRFDINDKRLFVNLIQKLMVNHHNRLSLLQLDSFFLNTDSSSCFNFGFIVLSKNEYYILEEGLMRDQPKNSGKLSFISIIFIVLIFFGLVLLGTFFFCKDSFFIFMPTNDLKKPISSENSGNCSLDEKDEKDEKNTQDQNNSINNA